MRLTAKTKEKILQFIKEGKSLSQISKEINIGKTTIYYYYRKINPPLYKKLSVPRKKTDLDGAVVGVFTGDGHFYFEPKRYKYEITITIGKVNLKYVEYIKNLFENHFAKKFYVCESGPCYKVRTCSKEIKEYYSYYLDYDSKKKHCTVKLRDMGLGKEFKKGFIRGLFDTDGSILFKRKENRIRIAFSTTSQQLFRQVKQILSEFDILYSPFTRKTQHKDIHVVQLRQRSINRFLKTFKPFKATLLKGQ